MSKMQIKFLPEGFAKCLSGMTSQVQAEAQTIASTASSMLNGQGTGFHVEMSNEARYQDSAYGVTRPVARVVANDEASSREEAENKILSKAVGK